MTLKAELVNPPDPALVSATAAFIAAYTELWKVRPGTPWLQTMEKRIEELLNPTYVIELGDPS